MGLLMSNIGWILIVITVAGIFIIKKATKNPDAVTSKYKATKVLNYDLSKSLTLIKKALENAGFIKVGYNTDDYSYYAQSKFSMSSWTEQIEIKLKPNDNQTELNFKSVCSLPTQIFDWGKNKRNYKKFERELKKLSGSSKA